MIASIFGLDVKPKDITDRDTTIAKERVNSKQEESMLEA